MRQTSNSHFEMQVGSRGTPGGPDFCDLLAALHQLTSVDQNLGGVGIACGQVLAVVDLHEISVLRMALGADDDAPVAQLDTTSYLCR